MGGFHLKKFVKILFIFIIGVLVLTQIHSYASNFFNDGTKEIVFKSSNEELTVHFIDVGQGDSILVQTPNGRTMLIDGGKREAGEKVVSYLKSLDINEINVVVATHPDFDHIGGLIDVIDHFEIGQFINSGKDHTTETYEKLIEKIFIHNIPYVEVESGNSIVLDEDVSIKILYADGDAEETNDSSIVIHVQYGEVSFLLTGDATTNIEDELISLYDLSSTILKAGHHGSNTSSSLDFLQAVQPDITILSYGEDNSFGHPHKQVLNNLNKIGTTIYSTAEDGTIIISTDGLDYDIYKINGSRMIKK